MKPVTEMEPGVPARSGWFRERTGNEATRPAGSQISKDLVQRVKQLGFYPEEYLGRSLKGVARWRPGVE